MTGVELVGVSASIIIVAAFIPQIVQAYQSKSVQGLNPWLFVMTAVGNLLLAVYGGLHKAWAVVATGALVAVASLLILAAIIIFQ